MTPLLTLSHLPSPPGSAGRAAARGCRCRGRWGGAGFGHFRAPRSTQEPGEGTEAKVRLRLPRPHYCPAAPEADNPGAGGLRRGAEALAQGARPPAPVYLDAVGGGGGTGLESVATAPRRRRRRRSCASRGRRARRAQDVLSHAAPAARLTLLWDLQHFLSGA